MSRWRFPGRGVPDHLGGDLTARCRRDSAARQARRVRTSSFAAKRGQVLRRSASARARRHAGATASSAPAATLRRDHRAPPALVAPCRRRRRRVPPASDATARAACRTDPRLSARLRAQSTGSACGSIDVVNAHLAASARCSSSFAARALSASANHSSSTSKTAAGVAASGSGACKSGSLQVFLDVPAAGSRVGAGLALVAAKPVVVHFEDRIARRRRAGATAGTAAWRTRIGRPGRVPERAGRIPRRLLAGRTAGQLLIQCVKGRIERIEIVVRAASTRPRPMPERSRRPVLIDVAVATSRPCRSLR